jgi:hypothetical protein
VRAAVTGILVTAREHQASAVVIEDLDFADARHHGRERTGRRPARGRRGRVFRHQIAGIPTAGFRDRLTGMAANPGTLRDPPEDRDPNQETRHPHGPTAATRH